MQAHAADDVNLLCACAQELHDLATKYGDPSHVHNIDKADGAQRPCEAAV